LGNLIQSGRLTYIDGLPYPSDRTLQITTKGALPSKIKTLNQDDSLETIESLVSKVLLSVTTETEKPLLLIDGLDFLLASSATTATSILDTLISWREVCQLSILND
jgi:hypothetical protein